MNPSSSRALVATVALFLLTSQANAALCDFDSDGSCDLRDIDALSEQVILGDPDFDPKFDLSGDGQLDLDDRDEWLSLAAIENGFGSPYFLGDVNLDGFVSALDLMNLALHWQQTGNMRWSNADFTMDDSVNVADLNELAINWQKKNPPLAAAVPEPMGFLLLLFGGAFVHRLARTRRRGLARVALVVSLLLSSLTSITSAQLACDFDSDGICHRDDIDALSEQVILGDPNFDPKFDLSGDGQLDLDDRDEWLSLAAIENGFGLPYFLGDADLDGRVNAADLMTLGLHWQTDADRWSKADFNMDGNVDAADLNAIGLNWQKQNPSAAAVVPEPTSFLLLLLGGVLLHRLARARRRGLALVAFVASLLLGSFTSITLAQPDCDLNGDSVCDITDVDSLTRAIASNSDDPLYDLNADGNVDTNDLDYWLASGAQENGFGGPYLTGDADLDGAVNAQDLNALGLSWQQFDKAWSQGDFWPDGHVNAADLMSLAINWQQTVPRAVAAAVPEPMSCVLLILGGWLLFHNARRVSTRSIVVPLLLCGFAEAALAQPLCDLDGDGDCDVADIDDLTRVIPSGVLTDPKYDLTMDGILDVQDLDAWLVDGGAENGFARPYLLGDANLDGAVNAADLNAVGLSWQQTGKVWSQGDFSVDGFVSSTDLMLIGLNWQAQIPRAAATVPEPMSFLLLFVGAIGVYPLARRHRRQAIATVCAVWLIGVQSGSWSRFH